MSLERILVVDNEKRWRSFFERILEAEGYTVAVADDYEKALQELKRCFYPVVVVDVRLLGDWDSEGLRLIQEMDSLYPVDAIHKIIVSGWLLKPEETEQIARVAKNRSVSFLSKGGENGAGFDRLRFVYTVWRAFAQLRRPVRCFFSGEDCNKKIEPKMDQVFVAMPYALKSPGITINMDDIYIEGIRPAMRDLGYNAMRADETPFVGALICNVCGGIQESVMCIADITDWNPNVLLELGLMYGWGKTTIILKHAKSDVPTNLKFTLYVKYDGLRSLKSGLKKLIRGLQKQPRSPASP
jgi:CheY-like chemotaxis protein